MGTSERKSREGSFRGFRAREGGDGGAGEVRVEWCTMVTQACYSEEHREDGGTEKDNWRQQHFGWTG